MDALLYMTAVIAFFALAGLMIHNKTNEDRFERLEKAICERASQIYVEHDREARYRLERDMAALVRDLGLRRVEPDHEIRFEKK